MATAAVKRREKRNDAAQRRLAGLGVQDAVKLARAIRQSVNNPVTFRVERERALVVYAVLLADAMTAAYLLGIIHVVRQARADTGQRLKMSAIGDELERLAGTSEAFSPALIARQKKRFGKVGAQMSQQIGNRLTEHVDTAMKRLREQGISPRSPQGQTKVRAAFAKAGVGPEDLNKPYLLDTMFRTQTEIGYAVGREAAIENPLIAGMLWGFEYATSGDDRVRATHEAMNGTKLPKDDPFWATSSPPNGWNCHCRKLLVFEDDAPKTPTEPEVKTIDGEPTAPVPDKGWAFNPGTAFRDVLADRPPLFVGEVSKRIPIKRAARLPAKPRTKPPTVPQARAVESRVILPKSKPSRIKRVVDPDNHHGLSASRDFERRRRKGAAGFDFFQDGKKVTSAAEIRRLSDLRAPPGWRSVFIAADRSQKLQMVGIDTAGRVQRRYAAKFTEAQAKKKFVRVREFSAAVPRLRLAAARDRAKGVAEAYLVKLEDLTAIRAGNPRDVGARVKAYGLTTLEGRHVSFRGATVKLDFVAKEGLRQQYTIVDSELADWLKRRKKQFGAGPLFPDSSASKVNAYIKAKGGDFSIKDFRTYHATRIAYQRIAPFEGASLTVAQKRKLIGEVSEAASGFLHNLPAQARASYIDPSVWQLIGGL